MNAADIKLLYELRHSDELSTMDEARLNVLEARNLEANDNFINEYTSEPVDTVNTPVVEAEPPCPCLPCPWHP